MRAVPAVAAQWLVVAAAQPIHQESLSLQNDFWFNHLRGIAPAHDHVSYVGALSQRAGSFDALPIADFYLLMVYSPWWQHCRRAVVEFNRLAAVLRPADLRPLLMDCTRPVNEKMCSRFLGSEPQPELHWEGRREYVKGKGERPFVGPAALLVARHRFRRAEGLSEESQEALEATYQVAQAMAAEGQHREAVKLFAYLHKIYQRKKGDTHLDTLAAANNLAGGLSKVGDLEEASEVFQKAVASSGRLLGQEHPLTLKTKRNLVVVLHQRGHLKEAKDLQIQLVSVMERSSTTPAEETRL
eukprot:g23538.t1